MTQAAYEHVADAPATEAPADVLVRCRPAQSARIAIGSLMLVCGVALGVMVAGGAVLHLFDHRRHVDIFAALHNLWVVAVLLGLAVLWLLPPYPWATNVLRVKQQERVPMP